MTDAIQNSDGYKAVKSAQGEDRSSYQPIGPWTADDFGFTKATEGLTWTDPTFEANWKALRTQVKFRGAYHFLHLELGGEEQAAFFLSFVQEHGGLEPGDMLVVDSEIMTGPDGALQAGDPESRMASPNVTFPATLTGTGLAGDVTLAFLEKLGDLLGENKYRNPRLLYTNLSVAAVLGNCTEFDLWIAYPSFTAPPNVKPWENWRFWQWGWGGGQGGGDRDAYNGTLADLTEWIDSFKNSRVPDASSPSK
ncbi:MAG: GH25 family lysozyme [Streptosporangiaceae bacterium]|jgi:glycosyl hydrolase family 25